MGVHEGKRYSCKEDGYTVIKDEAKCRAACKQFMPHKCKKNCKGPENSPGTVGGCYYKIKKKFGVLKNMFECRYNSGSKSRIPSEGTKEAKWQDESWIPLCKEEDGSDSTNQEVANQE